MHIPAVIPSLSFSVPSYSCNKQQQQQQCSSKRTFSPSSSCFPHLGFLQYMRSCIMHHRRSERMVLAERGRNWIHIIWGFVGPGRWSHTHIASVHLQASLTRKKSTTPNKAAFTTKHVQLLACPPAYSCRILLQLRWLVSQCENTSIGLLKLLHLLRINSIPQMHTKTWARASKERGVGLQTMGQIEVVRVGGGKIWLLLLLRRRRRTS